MSKTDDSGIERAMLLEDYNALPIASHATRLHWVNNHGDYKPAVVHGLRVIPGRSSSD